LREVGGLGYESYRDGKNWDAITYCQGCDGKVQTTNTYFTDRYPAIKGIWRTEMETTPSAANGEMIYMMVASGQSSPDSVQQSLTAGTGEKVLKLTYKGASYTIHFPADAPPRISSP
jgi:hypothetical protein